MFCCVIEMLWFSSGVIISGVMVMDRLYWESFLIFCLPNVCKSKALNLCMTMSPKTEHYELLETVCRGDMLLIHVPLCFTIQNKERKEKVTEFLLNNQFINEFKATLNCAEFIKRAEITHKVTLPLFASVLACGDCFLLLQSLSTSERNQIKYKVA